MKRKSSGKRLFGMRNGRFFVSNTRLPEETPVWGGKCAFFARKHVFRAGNTRFGGETLISSGKSAFWRGKHPFARGNGVILSGNGRLGGVKAEVVQLTHFCLNTA